MAADTAAWQTFAFAFAARYRPVLLAFGVTPSTARVVVGPPEPGAVLRARFGPFLLDTTLDNVADVTVGGPYRPHRVIGPRLSLADRGVTFGTSVSAGVCVRFHEPVGALFGHRFVRHPGMTVTVQDPDGFARVVRARAGLA
ncbi:MAG TPA: hypothetical protein VK906_17640 [Egicoccus sp.]|nr:hypothetical protein [Egicoccus sp.]HSK25012.1 hypothetical protein [Egicoccus sp.]